MNPTALAQLVRATAVDVLTARDLDVQVLPAEPVVERPRNPEHGDYATNLALQTAKSLGLNPRELAGWLSEALAQRPELDAADVAGPGFVNLRLASDAQGEILQGVLAGGERYGHSDAMSGSAVNLEFVSANPTGPIHIGGTRWAAVGDALARVLQASGASVTREYYFNDAGTQIDRFVNSLLAAARDEPAPADGYGGDDVGELARAVLAEHPGALQLPEDELRETFRSRGVGMMFDRIKRSLHEFGTDFDVYFHEDSLHTSGAVQRVLAALTESDEVYFAEGAWWLRASAYGDDKDRVVIKSDGEPAYVAGDIAYLQDKRRRGFDHCIFMLGADHHGYVARLKAAAAAIGDDPAVVEVLIGQMVNLLRDGVPVRMSKRAGTVVTIEDLVEAIGVDAARYALIRSSYNTALDIDLELWSRATAENPVFYVQYAHARLCSLLRGATELGLIGDAAELMDPAAQDLALLKHEREGDLIRTLGEFPRIVEAAAQLREPHRIARYLEELAAAYHKFYDSCRVLPQGDEQQSPLTGARLALCAASRQVLANGLRLLGVSAPMRM